MVTSNDDAINQKIIEMRRNKARILTIHNWLSQWDNFKQLDEQLVLAHILNILDKAQMAVSRKEVRTCFDKYYNKEFHGERKGYLNWLYKEFNIKSRTVVESSQSRAQVNKKRAVTGTTEHRNAPESTISNQITKDTTKSNSVQNKRGKE